MDALQTFVVVAREGSMSRAADALFLTQSAVSRQIQQLEAQLGCTLFTRQARGIQLTRAGQTLLPVADQAFLSIRRAIEGLEATPSSLSVKMPPTLALRWFLPRLPHFQRQHPDIDVRMSTGSFSKVRFEAEGFDSAILYARQSPGDAYAERLFQERLTPVCSPDIAARLRTPGDLMHQALIHLTPDHADWRAWCQLAGIVHPAIDAGPSFEVIDMAVNVANQGLGVAIADPVLIADDLLCGRLVAPFPTLVLESGFGNWFVCPKGMEHDAQVGALLSWLRVELAATVSGIAASLPDTASVGHYQRTV